MFSIENGFHKMVLKHFFQYISIHEFFNLVIFKHAFSKTQNMLKIWRTKN